MKICFLGNSHLAAIKRSWDRRSDRPDWEPSFFGTSAYTVGSLQLKGDVLVSPHAKVRNTFLLTAGLDHVPLPDPDVFVLAGITFEFRDFLSVFKTTCLLEHSGMRTKRPLLSQAAYKQTMVDLSARLPGQRLANIIRDVTKKPIIVVASPCPSEAILNDKKFVRFASSASDPFLSSLYELYLLEARALAAANHWTFLPQQSQTLRSPGLSLEMFSTDSGDVGWTKDTSGPARRADDWHMNADYGRIVMDQVIEALGSADTDHQTHPKIE